MPSGEVRHGRRSRHPQAHPRLSVRPRRARAGALPRQRLHAVRPPLRRTLGTSASDRREGRGRGALALAPRWLAASGRFRGGRHAARPRPPEPHHQSILPGPTADLQLNTLSYRCISATPAPVNFRLPKIRLKYSLLRKTPAYDQRLFQNLQRKPLRLRARAAMIASAYSYRASRKARILSVMYASSADPLSGAAPPRWPRIVGISTYWAFLMPANSSRDRYAGI